MSPPKNTKSSCSTPSPERLNESPIDVKRFWSAGEDLNHIKTPPNSFASPALNRLGAISIPGGGFPLMGFFATVYDHVKIHVIAMTDPHQNQGID